jgi:hypothetical protein
MANRTGDLSMAQVIEFSTLTRHTPTVKWPSDEERGKVIPFMPQRGLTDELVCAAFGELDSEFSQWLECDGAPNGVAL